MTNEPTLAATGPAAGEVPRYRLIKPFYVHDFYINEGEIIDFEGEPNEEMEPMNAAAEERLRVYIAKLEEGRIQSGRISRRVDEIMFEEMRNRPREPSIVADNPRGSTKVELPKYRKDVPPTGNLKPNGGIKEGSPPPVKIIPQPSQGPQKPIAISSLNKEPYNASE